MLRTSLSSSGRGGQRSAIILSAVAFLVGNVYPLVNAGLGAGGALKASQLGHISSAFILSGALIVLVAPQWLSRIDWRWSCLAAVLGLGGAILAAAHQTSWVSLALTFCSAGVCSGVLQAITMACLGDGPDARRAYGISLAAQMALQTAVVTPGTAWVVPTWGHDGFMLALGLGVISFAGFTRFLPSKSRSHTVAEETQESLRSYGALLLPTLLSLVNIAIFMAGIFAVWIFLDGIGAAAGVEASTVGFALAASGIATIGSAALVALLGDRMPTLPGSLSGIGLSLTGCLLLTLGGTPAFVAGLFGVVCGWSIAQPYLWALTTEIDPSHRLFAVAPAALGIGGAVGSSLGGSVADTFGFRALAIAAGGSIAVSAFLAWLTWILWRRSLLRQTTVEIRTDGAAS